MSMWSGELKYENPSSIVTLSNIIVLLDSFRREQYLELNSSMHNIVCLLPSFSLIFEIRLSKTNDDLSTMIIVSSY